MEDFEGPEYFLPVVCFGDPPCHCGKPSTYRVNDKHVCDDCLPRRIKEVVTPLSGKRRFTIR